MGTVVVPSFGADPVTITGPTLDAKVDGLATEFNGSIDNDNIKAAAAIAYSKLNLTGLVRDADIKSDAAINVTKIAVTSQATGDLLYASSATVFARLAVGTTSQCLVGGTTPAWGNPIGSVVQVVNTQTGAAVSGNTAIPIDDVAPPQSDEGTEVMTLAVTPKATTNKLKIDVTVVFSMDNWNPCVIALFQDATASALAAIVSSPIANDMSLTASFSHYMAAGTVSATTFKVRMGSHGGDTFTMNGKDAGSRLMAGIMASSITITEIRA